MMNFASADLTSINGLDREQIVTLRQQGRHAARRESVRLAGTSLSASMTLMVRNDKRAA